MASTHKSLRSGTANKRPTTSIADGQIALNTNTTSPGLFFKDSTGATIIKVGPVHVGTTAPNASPAAGGSAGNSVGEIWLDTSLTPVGVKIWNGSAFVNATPIGSTTVQGLLELATNAETQTGTDPDRAVTPAGLQSKVSDSTSTTSSTTIASSTAVKSAYDLANAALPKSGGTVTGNLEIGTTGSLSFEGATADAFETTITVVDPTADRTITLPDTTGTVVTTGDTGTVTSTMIADGTIVNGDVNASAAIAGTKISPDFGSQTVQTTGIFSHALGTAAAPTVTFTGDTNTGIYSPGADQVAISTGGSGRLFVNSDGNISVGATTNDAVGSTSTFTIDRAAGNGQLSVAANGTVRGRIFADNSTSELRIGNPTANALLLFTNNTERLRITSAGLVGVGTSSPGTKLEVSGDILSAGRGTSFGYKLPDCRIFNPSSGGIFAIDDYTNTRFFIDSSGRCGIGSSSPQAILDTSSAVTLDGSGFYNVIIRSTDSYTTSPKSGIGFSTYFNGSQNLPLAAIWGGKENGVIGDYGSSLSLGTRANGGNITPRLTIDSSGRCGVGTTGPSALLHVNSSYSGYGGAAITDGSPLLAITGGQNKTIRIDGGAYQGGTSTANLHLSNSANGNFNTVNGYLLQASSFDNGSTNSNNFIISSSSYSGSAYTYTERLRIDSSGRLLVGTSTARTAFYSTTITSNILQLENTSNSAGATFFANSTTAGSAGFLLLGKSRGTSLGSNTAVQSGDVMGEIAFAGSDGTQPINGALIQAVVDGTPGTNDMPGRLVFSTTADGQPSPTERVRIDSNGALGVVCASNTDSLYVSNAAGAGTTRFLIRGRHGATGVYGGTESFVVYTNGNVQNTNNSYGAYSDIKLKENIVDANSQWDDLKALQVRNYNLKEGQTHTQIGLIAQEVELVSPGLVSESPDRDAEGNDLGTVTKSVNYSVLYMKAVKALQEAMQRIETLEAKVAALESA